MDLIIALAKTISEKFILVENGYANKELDKLSQLLLQNSKCLINPQMLSILEEIVKAQELKDYLYIADLLTYRLIPIILECA